MTKPTNISVLGAGAWATTVAVALARAGSAVTIWAREVETAREISVAHRNSRYLAGTELPASLRACDTLSEAIGANRLVFFGLPVQSLRAVARQARDFLSDGAVLVNLGKALERDTFARPSQILQREIRNCDAVGTLSGPNIAREVLAGIPTKAVVSCTDFRRLDELRGLFDQENFRVYTNPDLTGVELAGALKNVYAIMAGIGDGLGFGENTKGALLTRGLAEMVKVGTLMGGSRETFYGIAGMGDLFATASSPHSRNRRLGEALAKTDSLEQATASLGGRIAEGIETTRALRSVREQLNIEMPIAEELYHILCEGKSCAEGFKAIWARSPRSEVI